MRVPMRWLREYVDPPLPTQEIARLLTMAGTEVGNILHIGAEWEQIVIGRVLTFERHPNADNLNLARIDVGSEEITLVTAASNLKPGDVIPVVRSGGRLAVDRPIDARKFRGITSEGMLCAGAELGITPDADTICVLEPEAPIGQDLREFVGDDILDIELTPNRADCLGIVGIAREVSALTGAPLRLPDVLEVGADPAVSRVKVLVEDPQLCPRYVAGVIEGVRVGPSPAWLQRRLHLAGMRAINNIVDVTNYVMLELGQPLHAFDAARLAEATIKVRRAQPEERMTTLDGVERTLTSEMLVIADAREPVAIAGVMGGLNSEVGDETTTIVLESADFDPKSVRHTSRALRLGTEASKRFDKGLDEELPPFAARRALGLIAELAGGQIAAGLLDVRAGEVRPRTVDFTVADVEGLIGQRYGAETIAGILRDLGFEPGQQGDSFHATVPTWRGDVEGKADIAEEVARIASYDAIPIALPSGSLGRAPEDPALRWEEVVRSALAAAGLQEVKTYSLVDPYALTRLDAAAPFPPTAPDPDTIPIANPMSVDQSRLRTTLLPSLLKTLGANLRHERRVAIFELARVYLPPLDPLPREERRLAIAMAGGRTPAGWNVPESPIDFYDLKGAVEAAFRSIRATLGVPEPASAPWLHPARGATVRAETASDLLGLMGQVHPVVAERFDVEGIDVFAAEIDLSGLLALAREEVATRPLPRFPAVERDVALIVPEHITHAQVEAVIREAAGSALERLALFDVYRGSQVPEGHRSLAFSLTFRVPDRTLSDDEVDGAMSAVERRTSESLGARVRGRS
jgi:phenylalanyl-tRNA synthetase beta chain